MATVAAPFIVVVTMSTTYPTLFTQEISTIHAFCLRVCRRHLSRLKKGFDENFSVANKHEQMLIVKEALTEFDAASGIDPETVDPKMLAGRAKRILGRLQKHRSNKAASSDFKRGSEIEVVARHYEHAMVESNTLDFHGE